MMQEFSNKASMIEQLERDVLREIQSFAENNEKVHVLLSGGSTPIPLYKKLGETIEDPNKVLLGLIDERFVPLSSEFSNERMIRECFNLQNERFEVIGMVQNAENADANLELVTTAYQPFMTKTHVGILGMGEDGHYASLFPNDSASEQAVESKIYNTNAPAHPTQRVTCGLEMICAVESLYLIITGQRKKEVFVDLERNLPIHQLMEKRKDIKIYFSEL